MLFDEEILKPTSKKIPILEMDTPLKAVWINYGPGLWFTRLTPGDQIFSDDNGNIGFWGGKNTTYYNIGSLNVDGELYTEVSSLLLWETTDKSWFYDTDTTDFYIHLDSFSPPEAFTIISPGAILGFTKGVDQLSNNVFENVYYEPRLTSVPNISKKKDPLFFGILQYKGSSYTFRNEDGFFDNFASLDLYGQPLRVKLSFEGLPLSQAKTVYTGRVDDFSNNDIKFVLQARDLRKLLSRKLPINSFDKITYPSIDDELVGVPIPIIFGPVTKVDAYKASSGNWKFADTSLLNIDSGIIVYNPDGSVFSHGGTETDGTFTGSDTDDELTVDCSQTTIYNGLDVISFILENYENISFSALNYDLTEWNNEKPDINNIGLWLGRENNISSVKVIEQVCVDNQGIFDVLADGRFTFRKKDLDRPSSTTFDFDEKIVFPTSKSKSKEFLSSVKIQYAKNWKTGKYQIFTNLTFEDEVYARYRRYNEISLKTALTTEEEVSALSDFIMETSKFIFPGLSIRTKTQKIELRILDNALYTYRRENGNIMIPRSLYEVLGVDLNLNSFEITTTIRVLKDVTGQLVKQKVFKILPNGEFKLTPDGQMKQAIISI